MQRFLKMASIHPEFGLAYLAGAAGYADQAHLSREARRLTGFTPAAIIEQLSESKVAQDSRRLIGRCTYTDGRFVQDRCDGIAKIRSPFLANPNAQGNRPGRQVHRA
jgi:hypothetical protein